jgi:hypothetical protein
MSNKIYLHLVATGLAAGLATALVIQGQGQPEKTDCSMTHQHMDEMNKRGDKAMGFDHLKTTHHFLLATDGGVIQVETNKAGDNESSGQIRQHLRHIAMMFSNGDFDIPMFVHAQDPAGVEVMKQLKADISYKFEQTRRGGRVRIASSNADAIKAIHDFLSFQIKEHRTGDPLEIVK